MKTLFLASAFAFAAVSVSASAQPADGNTVTIKGNQAAIELPTAPHAMNAQEFDKFGGTYELANGQTIALYSRGGVKYAALHGEAAHALVAKSGNSFVARDRQLAVTIDLHEDGSVGGDVSMVVPAEKLADGSSGQRVVNMTFR